MSTFKFEVEKLDGKKDFNLWKEKMMAHLENLEIKIEDEDQAIFLLNSLPDQLRNCFLEHKPDHVSKVLQGNNNTCDVVDVGVIKLKMWDDLERNFISLGAMVESGWIYKAQGGALDVMKGFLVVVKGLLCVLQVNKVNEAAMFENKEEQVVLDTSQENNQKNEQEGGSGNLQKEDADDEAEVRGSLDCPKCHKQEKFEVFCVQEVISKREVEVVKVATEVYLLFCSPKIIQLARCMEHWIAKG